MGGGAASLEGDAGGDFGALAELPDDVAEVCVLCACVCARYMCACICWHVRMHLAFVCVGVLWSVCRGRGCVLLYPPPSFQRR